MTKKEKKIIYQQGITARESGYERISPYQNCKSQIYWLAGYDGSSFEGSEEAVLCGIIID